MKRMRKRRPRQAKPTDYLTKQQVKDLLERCQDENGSFDKTQLEIMRSERYQIPNEDNTGLQFKKKWRKKVRLKVQEGIRLLRYTQEYR